MVQASWKAAMVRRRSGASARRSRTNWASVLTESTPHSRRNLAYQSYKASGKGAWNSGKDTHL